MWRELYAKMDGKEVALFKRKELGELWDCVSVLSDNGHAEVTFASDGGEQVVIVNTITNPDLVLPETDVSAQSIHVGGDAVITNNSVNGSNVKIQTQFNKKSVYYIVVTVFISVSIYLLIAFVF